MPFCNRLARSVGKIDQDIQHPTAEEKHQTLAPEHLSPIESLKEPNLSFL
jgi:hypothetical protein